MFLMFVLGGLMKLLWLAENNSHTDDFFCNKASSLFIHLKIY